MGNNTLGNYGGNYDQSLVQHMCNFIGQTVTIFTTSGGASGCGFTGILMSVNCCYCRITTDIGVAPANPLSQHICPWQGETDKCQRHCNTIGSVCDIPIDRIAAFCHNAV